MSFQPCGASQTHTQAEDLRRRSQGAEDGVSIKDLQLEGTVGPVLEPQEAAGRTALLARRGDFMQAALSRVLLGLALMASGLGCGNAIDVHTRTAPNADFARYQTFAFGPPESAPVRYQESVRATVAERRTEDFVAEVLVSKGYKPAPNADLTVRIAAGVRRKELPIPLAPPAPGSTPGQTWLPENEAGEILEGALVVDVYETATGTLLWHGAANAWIDPDRFDEARLRRGVTEVMSSFPERRS